MAVPEIPKRIEILYKDALDNLVFLKEQQWAITKYALTAYGALFAAVKILHDAAYKGLLIFAVWLVFAFSAIMLGSFTHGMRRFRRRIRRIYRRFFEREERDRFGLPSPNIPLAGTDLWCY